MESSAPVVWLLTDNKPGHRNQLKGLGNRLRVLAGASTAEIDATTILVPLWRALLGIAPTMDENLRKPDLIIAAGSGTHRMLLSLRRRRKTGTVVLMKPGFPIGWVDAAIIPEHDGVAPGKNILTTEGVINAVTPLARITDKPEGLILIGGPSPHFDWDDDVVVGQVSQLMGSYPNWRWTISGSRRTPEPLLVKLQELAGPKVTVVDPCRTHDSWLPHQLAASRAAWVTPDSTSMVCEAATSGVPTGLFELAPKQNSRVARGMASLVGNGYVARWSDHATVMAGKLSETHQLWEADRAARWLIQHFLKGGKR
ncbi:ELM1/GtrOC1 family putative glycosyltransferase [Marinobacter sp. ATCH36]|uniref:mitochondrial fission ELM1 family protein n=1 Tax=Marinobacter sp. ATCH36 TaxID=2945106 RepID=UPI0020229259|nr:ELM1/GtrOC1 family putative glycosyltransferase [Marinobacter sp. ATCH36]MCL7945949.1 mitochondrial fission ELM1 family protein [Marinobacter sp. ATCH36]